MPNILLPTVRLLSPKHVESGPLEVGAIHTGPDPVNRLHQEAFRVDGMLVQFGSSGRGDSVVRNWSLGPLALMLLEVSDLSLTPDSIYAECLHLAVIRSGGITIEANGQMLSTGADSMLLIDLDVPHIQHFDKHSEAILLRVPRKIFADRGGFRERGLGLLALDSTEPDVRAFSDTVALIGRQGGHTSIQLRRRQGEHLLDIFSVIIADPHRLAGPRSSSARLLRAKQFISQNIGNVDLSVSLVASAIGMSEAHLHRLFRGDGHSLMRYVQCRRLELAAELLRRSNERHVYIKEIAYRCGFVNAAHFSRLFKQRFGVSPRVAATSGLKDKPTFDVDPDS
jgi:AraC-like DNA-binding protein